MSYTPVLSGIKCLTLQYYQVLNVKRKQLRILPLVVCVNVAVLLNVHVEITIKIIV